MALNSTLQHIDLPNKEANPLYKKNLCGYLGAASVDLLFANSYKPDFVKPLAHTLHVKKCIHIPVLNSIKLQSGVSPSYKLPFIQCFSQIYIQFFRCEKLVSKINMKKSSMFKTPLQFPLLTLSK